MTDGHGKDNREAQTWFYEQGRIAHKDGKPIADCPLRNPSRAREEWERGWREAASRDLGSVPL